MRKVPSTLPQLHSLVAFIGCHWLPGRLPLHGDLLEAEDVDLGHDGRHQWHRSGVYWPGAAGRLGAVDLLGQFHSQHRWPSALEKKADDSHD